MPISEDDIILEMQQDLENIDPEADTKKGPFKRMLIDPHAKPVARSRNLIDRMINIFTLRRVDNMTSAELEAQVAPFGAMTRWSGDPANGYVTFYFFSNPGRSITVSTGDQVSDSSGTLVFVVTQDVTIPADQIELFFNPINRRYEFQAPVEAIASGPDYLVPSYRINTLVSDIPFISGVVNVTDIDQGGTAQETNDQLDSRFRARLEGSERCTQGGLVSSLLNGVKGITDINLITAVDATIFSRRTERPAIDAYIIGSKSAISLYTVPDYLINNSNKVFRLPAGRVIKVDAVRVTRPGSTAVDVVFTVTPDQTAYAGSNMEVVTVSLDTAPSVGSIVEITYRVNSLIETVQQRASVIGSGPTALFSTDIVVYEGKPIDIEVEAEIGVLSSFSNALAISSVRENTLKQMNPRKFVDQLLPETYRKSMQNDVTVVSSFNVVKFRRIDTSTSMIQPIVFKRNEYPVLKISNLKLTART